MGASNFNFDCFFKITGLCHVRKRRLGRDALHRHYGQMWLWWGETSGRAAEHDAVLFKIKNGKKIARNVIWQKTEKYAIISANGVFVSLYLIKEPKFYA